MTSSSARVQKKKKKLNEQSLNFKHLARLIYNLKRKKRICENTVDKFGVY